MHRWSKLFIPTLREAPADAEVASHKFLLRAGYIRQLGAGIYSYLFLGQRSMNKIQAIVRQEMDRIAQEFYLPALHPRELWEESGRWIGMGQNLFKLQDRKGAWLALGMTHEEVMTDIARKELRSYKQLPQSWYQIQSKFRDEPRPKAGLLRVRQFLMKDSYSFDIDDAGLDVSYRQHDAAYRAIFTRSGLNFVAVQADSGAMGGSQSQEFMVYAEAGEDLIVSCPQCDYAANLEKATSKLPPVEDLAPAGDGLPELVHTPGMRTIEAVGAFLNVDVAHEIKTLAYMALLPAAKVGAAEVASPVVVLLRGDHTLNLAKLAALFPGAREMRPMTAEEIVQVFHSPVGYLGPIGLDILATGEGVEAGKVTVILDLALEGRSNLIAGANREEYHLRNVTRGRDFMPTLSVDVRNVVEGETCPQCGNSPLKVAKAIEVGHIFKLGRRYSDGMGVRVLDPNGREVTPIMGCYGIGIERILTSAIEQNHDGSGFWLARSIAPFDIVVTVTNMGDAHLAATAEKVATELEQAGFDVLLDDRDERAGVKFKDADLVGIPYRINIGKKAAEGRLELITRSTASSQDIGIADVAQRGERSGSRRLTALREFPLAVTVKVVRASFLKHPVRNAILIGLGGVLLLTLIVCESIFGYYYIQYRHIVDERLQHPLFEQTAKIYAAPKEVRVGQKLNPRVIAQELRSAGYSGDDDRDKSRLGTYALNESSITIRPGPQSYHTEQGATVSFDRGLVSKISGDGGQELEAYELEPQLITGLSEGQNRTKRRLVNFNDLPPNLVNAVTSIEDRRFFEHGGVDYWRLLGALRDDLRSGRRREGGSTLTMQLARGFFLTPEKKLKRKIIEIAITFQLENRFNKQQIFQIYANEIPLGQQGSFAINGFGQAAQTYFSKDVRQLDLAQCAMLAGMIQHPSYLNPYRHPERVIQRRNLVLDAMVETGKVTKEQAESAKAEPLKLTPINIDAGEAPYFVDLVRDRLVQRMGDADFNHSGLRIYTSLDPDLQRAATEAVAEGMKAVDVQVEKLHARRVKAGDTAPINYPQVALIALNPHTGQVLALVGGRNYGASQFDHAVQHRPTGSIFKPFVYAAAFNTSLAGTVLTQPPPQPVAGEELVSADPAPPDPGRQSGVFTAATLLNNNLTTFENGYAPGNYHNDTRYTGEITARTALQFSQNNATVSLAQMVGYNNVASLARDAGIKSARGTPAVALGAYDATPLDMAGAYTVFANGGVKIDPWLLASIRSANGDVLNDYPPNSKPIMDPRVAYLTLALMENVINSGTAAGVRSMGFTAPAAGKTGTSRDAWFAGFTSNLLCVVWVGNDDYSDLKLEGGKAAAPIWANFMKRAVQMPEYSDTRQFPAPDGVSTVRLDKVTNLLADASCPSDYDAVFLDGTAPTQTCDQSAGDQRNVFQKIFGLSKQTQVAPGTPVNGMPALPATTLGSQAAAAPTQPTAETPPPEQQEKKKRGFFGRLFGGKGDTDKQQQQDSSQPH